MPALKGPAPKKRDLKLPECKGCDQCGDAIEGALYLLGYRGQYYCKVCFSKVAKGWPRPMGLSKRTGSGLTSWRKIRLSESDMAWAADIARQRQDGAVREGRKNVGREKDGMSSDALGARGELLLHLHGCQAELAAARVYDVEWPAHVGTYKTKCDLPPCPNLPNGGEVRGLGKITYNLPHRPKDDPKYDYIAVVGTPGNPDMVVIGHKRGIDCRVGQPAYPPGSKTNKGEKAWWTPLSKLDAPPEWEGYK